MRFDQVKGYGFIAPRGGGDDVFLHVNDLLDEKHLVTPGTIVEFVVESGDRGLKASSVHVVASAPQPDASPVAASRLAAPPAGGGGTTSGDAAGRTSPSADAGDAEAELVDVLAEAEFRSRVTEALLAVEPALTGPQILAVRQTMTDMATMLGWIAG